MCVCVCVCEIEEYKLGERGVIFSEKWGVHILYWKQICVIGHHNQSVQKPHPILAEIFFFVKNET